MHLEMAICYPPATHSSLRVYMQVFDLAACIIAIVYLTLGLT